MGSVSYEKKPDELGALWLKSGAKGQYMTGEINGVKVTPPAPTTVQELFGEQKAA